MDAGVCKALNMGSDHRAISMSLRLTAKKKGRWRRGKDFTKSVKVGWRPPDIDSYKNALDQSLADSRTQGRFDDLITNVNKQLQMLESLVKETAALCGDVDR
eukprot:5230793-Karenia_brevis.AAC.1